MRRAQLLECVEEIAAEQWHPENDDVLTAVVEDEGGFGALCAALNAAGGDDVSGISVAFEKVADSLDDNTLDWLVGDTADGSQADSPAAFLAARTKELCG